MTTKLISRDTAQALLRLVELAGLEAGEMVGKDPMAAVEALAGLHSAMAGLGWPVCEACEEDLADNQSGLCDVCEAVAVQENAEGLARLLAGTVAGPEAATWLVRLLDLIASGADVGDVRQAVVAAASRRETA